VLRVGSAVVGDVGTLVAAVVDVVRAAAVVVVGREDGLVLLAVVFGADAVPEAAAGTPSGVAQPAAQRQEIRLAARPALRRRCGIRSHP
jgi:hypothetical protein